jgi:hypothetical protein
MADYLKLLGKGSELVGLKEDVELIESLVALATHWPELKAHITGVDSVEDFLGKLIAHLDDADIKAAFEKVGKPELIALHAKLVSLLKKLREKIDGIPPELRLLLSPMSRFNGPDASEDGAIAWTPLDGTQKFGEGGDFSFEIGGSARLSLAAGAKVRIGQSDRKLLKVAAALGVHAKAGGSAPFAQGKISGSFSAEASAGLAFLFSPDSGGSLYGFELARRLPGLPNPFDFAAVWEAFASPELRLTRISYDFSGTASASVSLSIANSLSFGTDVVADLSLAVNAEMKRAADYKLAFTAAATPGQVDASLTRKHMSEEAIGLKLAIDVDLSQLAKRVQAEVNKVVDKWDSVLKEVKPFLSPGTLVQTELPDLLKAEADRLIGNAGLKDALLRDLRGLIGIQTSSDSRLADWLSGELTGAIDAAGGVLTKRADEAADAVLARLADRLPAFAQLDVAAQLKPAIDNLISGLEGRLKDLADGLFRDQRTALGAALKKAGAIAADAVADADAALAGLRKVVERFDKLVHDTVATLGDASRMRITASVQAEERRSQSDTFEIGGTFVSALDDAPRAFHALTRGRPSDLRELLAGGTSAGGFVLDPASKLSLYGARTSKLGYEVVLFGFAANGEEIAKGEARVVLGADGSVQVDSSARIERRFSTPGEDREIKLLETFSLQRAKLEQDKRVIDIGVSIAHNDKSLKRDELKGFMQSLSAVNLLPGEVVTRADAVLLRWAGGDDPERWPRANIAAKLWLGTDALREMMAVDRRQNGRLNRADSVRIVKIALSAVMKTRALADMNAARVGAALGFIRDQFYHNGYPHSQPEDIIWDMLMEGERHDVPSRHELANSWSAQLPTETRLRADVRRWIEHLRGQFHDLVAMIDIMGQIYLAQPETLGGDSPAGWDRSKYVDMQAQLARSGKGWLKIGVEWLFWIDREVQPWTVSLLYTLAVLATGKADGVMSITMTRPAGTGVPAETVDLGQAAA